MNRTKIEWTDYTWNPITGCKHGCWYCYAHKMFTRFHRSFEPTFHPERLKEPWELSKPSKIFCCSVADLFAPWTEPIWRKAVLESILHCPIEHDFQLLTKNADLITVFDTADLHYAGKKFWLGATVTCQSEMQNLFHLLSCQAHIHFASFEPLLGNIDFEAVPSDWYSHLEWIIIGKLTGGKKVPLQKEWVQNIIDQARQYNIPIFIKNNVGWPEKIQEFPK